MKSWNQVSAIRQLGPIDRIDLVKLIQDDLYQFEVGLAIDVFKIDMARPGRAYMIVLGEIYAFANPLDRFHEGPGIFADTDSRCVNVFYAVSVNLW